MTDKLGGGILIAIGLWVLYQFYKPAKERDLLLHEKTLLNVEVQSLGLVIHILRKPTSADIDRSGTINGMEAVLLGIALSIDAFGAGIGAAILGFFSNCHEHHGRCDEFSFCMHRTACRSLFGQLALDR